ncbi:hypothetical protein GCM10009661_25370 [Catellatospora chokoriensis]|uniref:Uncharacterized protein n=1 Tax=Catellatospora chokoriensis TaxID=310353 RepID=A0A8J3JMR9_9ACTN|nr:hypothetical protein Cch02nite_12600 [Catellatospora chokoriensis]
MTFAPKFGAAADGGVAAAAGPLAPATTIAAASVAFKPSATFRRTAPVPGDGAATALPGLVLIMECRSSLLDGSAR